MQTEQNKIEEQESFKLTPFKIIILIISIPFILTLLGNLIGLGLTIYIGVISKLFVGILLMFLALFLGNVLLLIFFTQLILDKKTNGIFFLIGFIVAILMFIGGIFYTGYEFSKIKLVSPESKNYEITNVSETLPLADLYRTQIDNIDVTKNSPEVIYDNTLNNEMKLKIDFYDELSKIEIKKDAEGKYEITNTESPVFIVKSFFNTLKDDQILDYNKFIENKVTIYINKKDINKVDLSDGYYVDGVFFKTEDNKNKVD